MHLVPEEGRHFMEEWGVPEGYACQGFVIFGYIDADSLIANRASPDESR